MLQVPESKYTRLKTGLNYHYLEWGSDPANTHTVILIHGFLDSAYGWMGLINEGFTKDLHVVALDMRGHGDSEWIGNGGYYHFVDYVADLHEFITSVGRETVSLIGHSMGGGIAGYYAGTFPDQIHSLALLEGTGPPEGDLDMPLRTRNWIRSWERARNSTPRVYPTVQDAADRLCQHDERLDKELAKELAKLTTKNVPGGCSFKHDPVHLTLGPYPFRVQLAQSYWQSIRCPVMLVEGSESKFRHPEAEAARRHSFFRNPTHEIISGAGHMMQRHQPKKLSKILRKFLSLSPLP